MLILAQRSFELILTKMFRKKLAGRDAGVELQMVVEDLFNG